MLNFTSCKAFPFKALTTLLAVVSSNSTPAAVTTFFKSATALIYKFKYY